MEDPEVPTEHLQEHMQEHAAGSRGWIMQVALAAAIFSALAAVASLKAGHSANESMLAQIESANQWAFFQSKSIKGSILRSKMDLMTALGKGTVEKDTAKLHEYENDLDQIKTKAEHLSEESHALLHQHETLSHGVTLFQICISISAMSVLVRSRKLWIVGLAFGAGGIVFLVKGLMFALN